MFPSGDLSRMQSAQQNHMPDTCHRSVHSYLPNDYGEQKSLWTENLTDIPCGIEHKNSTPESEQVESRYTTIEYDAIVRLPISQAEVWDVKDRVIITKRFGASVTPVVYGIAAPVLIGPSGIRLILRKVEV